jgi:hypothetical protein
MNATGYEHTPDLGKEAWNAMTVEMRQEVRVVHDIHAVVLSWNTSPKVVHDDAPIKRSQAFEPLGLESYRSEQRDDATPLRPEIDRPIDIDTMRTCSRSGAEVQDVHR